MTPAPEGPIEAAGAAAAAGLGAIWALRCGRNVNEIAAVSNRAAVLVFIVTDPFLEQTPCLTY